MIKGWIFGLEIKMRKTKEMNWKYGFWKYSSRVTVRERWGVSPF